MTQKWFPFCSCNIPVTGHSGDVKALVPSLGPSASQYKMPVAKKQKEGRGLQISGNGKKKLEAN